MQGQALLADTQRWPDLARLRCASATLRMAGRALSTIDWDQVRVFLAVARA